MHSSDTSERALTGLGFRGFRVTLPASCRSLIMTAAPPGLWFTPSYHMVNIAPCPSGKTKTRLPAMLHIMTACRIIWGTGGRTGPTRAQPTGDARVKILPRITSPGMHSGGWILTARRIGRAVQPCGSKRTQPFSDVSSQLCCFCCNL